MSRTALTLIISIGLAVAVGIYVGVKSAGSLAKELRGMRFVNRPPDEYLDLFKGPDSGSLQFRDDRLNVNRNPTVRFYDGAYEILETKFKFPDKGRLSERINIVQGQIAESAYSWYDEFESGRIVVNLKSFDQPDTGFETMFVNVEGSGFSNALTNDSVFSWVLERGYFSISRSAGGQAVIYSSKNDKRGGSGSTSPTAVLFKRRGNALFVLVASPVGEQTEIPKDLLVRLIGDK
jgi:hypothetical protein